jgi:hypothetical protein
MESLKAQLETIENSRVALNTIKDVPFVWDIAFVEIFEGEKEGFDILIGNPPYVRQEHIADPHLAREEVTTQNKKDYKAKLAGSLYQAFPRFFGYNVATDSAIHQIDAKSDLYVYFYFHGLSLLNPKGSFCFITSNSWLDVGYGKNLQEFLLKHCHVKMLLDNQARRSFAQADVNTVIALFSPPDDRREWALDKTARFVMFKVPFEHIFSPIIFDEIEALSGHKTTPEYRAVPVQQKILLNEGFAPPEATETAQRRRVGVTSGPLINAPRYVGNKWGGKYLRAPDIYFTVQAKGAHFARSLSEYFKGERYLNTGGADGFFIISDVRPSSLDCFQITNGNTCTTGSSPFVGEIERDFLVPLVKDYTKHDKRIEIHGHDAYCLVIKGEPSPRVKEYIKWGEHQGYHERSVTRMQRPWFKPTRQMLAGAHILVPRSFNDSFVIHYNPRAYLSLRFYRLHLKQGSEIPLIAYLNTTLIALILETLGNKSLGQGVLDFFMADFLALRIPVIESPDLETAFNEIKDRPVLSVIEEYGLQDSSKENQLCFEPQADRKRLDDIVFEHLGLTSGERQAVYEAVINLVQSRLKKAESLKPSRRWGRVEAARKTRGIWEGLPQEIDED